MKSVVDTCIFNKLIDGLLSTEDLPSNTEFVATHIQIDELNRTIDVERRAKLFLRFATLVDSVIPTESAVFNVSRWDHCKLGDGALYKRLKADLDTLNNGKVNNTKDALIAEVAIANQCTLLTADYHLAEAAKKNGCHVRYFEI
jgi:predicted nucleic acid-binding protein